MEHSAPEFPLINPLSLKYSERHSIVHSKSILIISGANQTLSFQPRPC